MVLKIALCKLCERRCSLHQHTKDGSAMHPINQRDQDRLFLLTGFVQTKPSQPCLGILCLSATLAGLQHLFGKREGNVNINKELIFLAEKLWKLSVNIITSSEPWETDSVALMRRLAMIGCQTYDSLEFLNKQDSHTAQAFHILVDCGLITLSHVPNSYSSAISASLHSELLTRAICDDTLRQSKFDAKNELSNCLAQLRAIPFLHGNSITKIVNVLTIWEKALEYPILIRIFKKFAKKIFQSFYDKLCSTAPWTVGYYIQKTLDKFNSRMSSQSPILLWFRFINLNYIFRFEFTAIGQSPYSYFNILSMCQVSRQLFDAYTRNGKTGSRDIIYIFRQNSQEIFALAKKISTKDSVQFYEEALQHFTILFERRKKACQFHDHIPWILKCLIALNRCDELLPILQSISALVRKNKLTLFKKRYSFFWVGSNILTDWPELCKLPLRNIHVLKELIGLQQIEMESLRYGFENNYSRIGSDLTLIATGLVTCLLAVDNFQEILAVLKDVDAIRIQEFKNDYEVYEFYYDHSSCSAMVIHLKIHERIFRHLVIPLRLASDEIKIKILKQSLDTSKYVFGLCVAKIPQSNYGWEGERLFIQIFLMILKYALELNKTENISLCIVQLEAGLIKKYKQFDMYFVAKVIIELGEQFIGFLRPAGNRSAYWPLLKQLLPLIQKYQNMIDKRIDDEAFMLFSSARQTMEYCVNCLEGIFPVNDAQGKTWGEAWYSY